MYEHIYTDTYIYIYLYIYHRIFSLTRRAQQSLRWHAFMEQHSTHSGGRVLEIQMVVQFTAWIKGGSAIGTNKV